MPNWEGDTLRIYYKYKKSKERRRWFYMTNKFDAIVIGFGKAGKTLAGDLGSKGQKVALIEKSPNMYGGTCINKACIPTKALENSAGIIRR